MADNKKNNDGLDPRDVIVVAGGVAAQLSPIIGAIVGSLFVADLCLFGGDGYSDSCHPPEKGWRVTNRSSAASTDALDLDRPLLAISELDYVSARDSFEGWLVTSSSGGGKTANIGKNIAHALVKAQFGGAQFGGLVLAPASRSKPTAFRR